MNKLLLYCLEDRDFDDFFSGRFDKLPVYDFYAQIGDCIITLADVSDVYTIKYKGPLSRLRWLPYVPTSSTDIYFLGSAKKNDLEEIEKLISYWFYLCRSIVENNRFKTLLPVYIVIGNPSHLPLKLSLINWRYRYRVFYYGFEFEPSLIKGSHQFCSEKNFQAAFGSFILLLKKFSDLYGLL